MQPARSSEDPIADQLDALIAQYKKDYAQVPVFQQFMQLGFQHQRYDIMERELNELLKWGQQRQHFYFLLATVQEKQNDYAKASKSIRQMFETGEQLSDPMLVAALRILPRSLDISNVRYCCEFLEDLYKGQPENPAVVMNLAECYKMLGRHDEAVALYKKTAQRLPFEHPLHFAYGIAELDLTNLKSGFEAYYHRFQLDEFKAKAPFCPWPEWNGEPLKGKKIYLWAEQGVGDMLMWAGLLPWLVEQGADVTCAVYPKMLALLKRSFPNITFVTQWMVLPKDLMFADFDYHSPMGNLMQYVLPHYTPAEHGAFLVADKDAVAKKRAEYLAKNPKAKKLVGVSWHSEAANGWRRHIALEDFAPQISDPETVYISLQYNQRLDDADNFSKQNSQPLHYDLSFLPVDDIDAWATQIAAMDEVISIQNSAVHLAGALGVKSTLFLSTFGSWHWGTENTKNHWYSSVKIYRQKLGESWKELIQKAAKEK